MTATKTPPFVCQYALRLWLATQAARRAFGEAPYRAGEDYESSQANARFYERRTAKVRSARFSVLQDFRHAMRQMHRDLKRRGKSNREGANNRRWRKYKASCAPVIFETEAYILVA